jgi:cation transport protein ChaC
MICPDMTRDEQVRCIATGSGFLGSSLEYVENLESHFHALGVRDPEISDLLADARTYADGKA